MKIDDIITGAINHERDTGRAPRFVLLTSDEYDAVKAEAEAVLRFTNTRDAAPVIHGMTIVIEGARRHQTLNAAGVEMLRPNA